MNSKLDVPASNQAEVEAAVRRYLAKVARRYSPLLIGMAVLLLVVTLVPSVAPSKATNVSAGSGGGKGGGTASGGASDTGVGGATGGGGTCLGGAGKTRAPSRPRALPLSQ